MRTPVLVDHEPGVVAGDAEVLEDDLAVRRAADHAPRRS